jgi:hypothetical protein
VVCSVDSMHKLNVYFKSLVCLSTFSFLEIMVQLLQKSRFSVLSDFIKLPHRTKVNMCNIPHASFFFFCAVNG